MHDFKKKKVCISHIPNLCYTKGKLHFMEKQIISQLFSFHEQNEHNMLADEKRETQKGSYHLVLHNQTVIQVCVFKQVILLFI